MSLKASVSEHHFSGRPPIEPIVSDDLPYLCGFIRVVSSATQLTELKAKGYSQEYECSANNGRKQRVLERRYGNLRLHRAGRAGDPLVEFPPSSS